ncbi:MAG: hypothetical protein Q9222_001009 [Ikaeria aurantiellina]
MVEANVAVTSVERLDLIDYVTVLVDIATSRLGGRVRNGAAPTISDGIVLTGFSLNTCIPEFYVGANFEQAYLSQPFRFANAPIPTTEKIVRAFKQPLTVLENKCVQDVLEEESSRQSWRQARSAIKRSVRLLKDSIMMEY